VSVARPSIDDDPVPPESVLSFVVAGRTRLAIDARFVAEVVDAGPLTPLPRAPVHIDGLAQVRGRPVPVLNLARFFALRSEPAAEQHEDALRLVVVRAGAMEVALLGRSVLVEDVAPESIRRTAIAYGERLRPHVRAEARTRRGFAVLLDLPGVLAAARVRD
jgi:chemotaxis signal transduction protein